MNININNFRKTAEVSERVALVYGFDTSGWNTFKTNERSKQQGLSQVLKTNAHSNTTPHSNLSPHSNSNPHSNGTYHSNRTNYSNRHRDTSPHSDNSPHSDGYTHANLSGGGHSQGHSDRATGIHANSHYNRTSTGHSDNSHYDKFNHSNGSRHSDYTYTTSSHSDNSPHSNTTPHSNGYGHSNTNPHSNAGFDHTNYVPSTPEFFDHVTGERVKGNITLAIYSYDDNNRPVGSQTVAAKEVYYDLKIRKVRNLDGTAAVSAWRTLLSNVKESSINNGVTFDLNTKAPLDTVVTTASIVDTAVARGNEGFYEVQAIARNVSQSGAGGVGPITYESVAKTIELKVQQNTVANVSVDNTAEIINFWFGSAGSYTTTGPARKIYGTDRFADDYSDVNSKNQGIFVKLSMTDPDTWQYQTGKVYLRDRVTNALIASADIYWSQSTAAGSTKVQSGGVAKTGYAYIDKSLLGASVTNRDCVLEVEITDYEDSGLTTPTGDVLTFKTYTSTGGAQLNLNIDTKAPTFSHSANTNSLSYKVSDVLTILPADTGGTGVYKTYYRYTEKWDNGTKPQTAWIEYTGPVTFNAAFDRSGTIDVEMKSVDNAFNESAIQTRTLYLDNKPPVGSISINDDSVPDSAQYTIPQVVNLTLSADDGNGGGTYQMRFKNENDAWSAWETFSTSKAWTLSAGNGNKTVYVQFRDATLNESIPYSDTIMWDNINPTGLIKIKDDSITDGEQYTIPQIVNLEISSADNMSGPKSMRFRNESGAWSAWEPYNVSKVWTLSNTNNTKTVEVQFMDNAGNVSNEGLYLDNIIWDDTVPTGTIQLMGEIIVNDNDVETDVLGYTNDFTYTQKQTITLNLTQADNYSGIDKVRFRNETGVWSAWEDYQDSRPGWTLSNGNGVKTVGIQFKDKAGNESVEYTDDIIWDNTPPTANITSSDIWENNVINALINVNDTGGSGIKVRKYAVTRSATPPSLSSNGAVIDSVVNPDNGGLTNNGWVDFTANTLNIDVTAKGISYIHVYVEDNSGNDTYMNKVIKVNKSIEILDIFMSSEDYSGLVKVDNPSTPQKEQDVTVDLNGVQTYILKNTKFTSKYTLKVDGIEHGAVHSTDRDVIDIRYKITNLTDLTDGPAGDGIVKTGQVYDVAANGTYDYNTQVWYLDEDGSFDNWQDGLYQIEFMVTDNKLSSPDAFPATHDRDTTDTESDVDISVATGAVNILIQRTVPQAPTFDVKNVDGHKEITIDYHADISKYKDYPILMNLYKYEYKVGIGAYTDYTGKFSVYSDTSIIARITDFAGNEATSVINIFGDNVGLPVIDGNGNTVGGNDTTKGLAGDTGEATVEENRATINYYINIRKKSGNGINPDTFKFLND